MVKKLDAVRASVYVSQAIRHLSSMQQKLETNPRLQIHADLAMADEAMDTARSLLGLEPFSRAAADHKRLADWILKHAPEHINGSAADTAIQMMADRIKKKDEESTACTIPSGSS